MSFALASDQPPPRDIPWGAVASVALHAGLAAFVLFASPLKQMVVPTPAPVAVEIVTEAEFAALQSPPEAIEPAPAAPAQSAPAAVEPVPTAEERLPTSPPLQPDLPENPTITASEFYTANLLKSPAMAQVRRGLPTLAISERVVQLCNIEGLEQIRRAAPHYAPDTLVPFAMADPMASGLTLRANGAAFRSRRRWYGIAFSCTAGPDLESVTAFEFKLGDPIPEDLWEDHNLNAADAVE